MIDDLLIATWNQVFVRRFNGDIKPVLDSWGAPFYGLTWDGTYLYIGARMWDIADHDHLIVLDRDLRRVDEYELPTRGQLHQILWRDGWIYLTNTANDRVLRWKPDGWEVIFDLGTGADVHHINSLWYNGRHWWATGLYGHVWKDWKPWGQLPHETHNIYIDEDGTMITCASREGSVDVGKRLVSLVEPSRAMRPVFTHGLARGPDYFYIGAALLAERSDRNKDGSAVVVFDEDWQVHEVLHFEDVGGIHDIRVLGDDRAHNGVVW